MFSAKAKLNISDVHSLQEYPDFPGGEGAGLGVQLDIMASLSSTGVYCVLNHPIVSVHIVGDVVSISRKNLLIAYEGESI